MTWKFGLLMLACLMACARCAVAVDEPAQAAALAQAAIKVSPVKGGGWAVEVRSAASLNDQTWKLIESIEGVKRFDCGGEAFDDAALARLSRIASLERIFLNGPSITDGGLAALTALPKLQSLGVHHSMKLTGVGVSALKPVQSLTAIEFGGSAVGDSGVKAIVELKQLKEVRLGHVRITRASFPQLAALPNLELLMITPNWDPNYYTAADFASLAPMEHLREFEVHDMVLPFDGGLDQLVKLKSLKTVKLLWCYITPEDLKNFKEARPDLKVEAQYPAGEDKLKDYQRRVTEINNRKK